ncbi:MAG TPA: hypothetical protein VGM67_19390 [Gemmatimonadaceae bacterium]
MSFSATVRSRAYIAAGFALTLGGLSACKNDSLLQVTDPDILNVSDYNTPAGADPLRLGVISNFQGAFDGSFVIDTGNLTDEMLASDTFNERLGINARKSDPVEANGSGTYSALQKARASATSVIQIIKTTQPTPAFNRGELYMIRGYSEMFLGEEFCSGIPFSSEDGVTRTYGDPLTTTQVFTTAVASFDSALAIADTSQRVKYGAQIGKGRALLSLGRFADAAAAVAGVPQSFQLLSYHSTGAGGGGMWSTTTNGATRYTLTSSEGINGLPYLAGHSDPRLPWVASTRTGFNSLFINLPNQTKYGRYDNAVIDNGIDAQLTILENTLQANTQAARQAVYDGLNKLRASGPPVVPAMTTGAPTTQDAAIDLLYSERAYWEWLNGHREGDERNLVRIYKRDPEKVFPTGALTLPLVGTYGTGTNIQVPYTELNNPKFTGCLPGA